jgi:hypothetical protein
MRSESPKNLAWIALDCNSTRRISELYQWLQLKTPY